MADQNQSRYHESDNDVPNILPSRKTPPEAERQAPRLLPPWKVVLHNDDVNEMHEVIEAIYQLTPLNREQALARMQEAHNCGSSLLLITHRERAELYIEQFQSCRLNVTIEPAV